MERTGISISKELHKKITETKPEGITKIFWNEKLIKIGLGVIQGKIKIVEGKNE